MTADLEKSFETFNASISGIQETYSKIWHQLDGFQFDDSVPRDYLKEMAGNLAHEIRNPLAGISNLVELLSEDHELKRTKNIQGILEGVDRIDKIVENLIVFSRPMNLQTIECNFLDTIKRAITTVRIQNKEIEARYSFLLNLPEQEIYLKLDPILMLQALQNILQNAIENMPEGGSIKLSLTENHLLQELILIIQDHGCGLVDDNAEKPFYPFYTTKTSGMGLGLPTAHLIITNHGGKIFLQNNEEKGVVVTIKLPMTCDE